MRNKNDEKLIQYFSKTRNIKPNTTYTYKLYLHEYADYYNTTITDLLKEAENEEEQGIRWKHRTLKKRLTEYRIYLYDKYSSTTAKDRFSKIRAFYRHYDIEIHQLPSYNLRNVDNVEPIRFEDLPDKEVIRAAVDIASPLMKAIILFISSSGSARAETLSLTVDSYIKSLKSYVESDDIYYIIETVNKMDSVVPTFNIRRVKTNKYYTTFCSPETVTAINHYLLTRTDKLTKDSPLFNIKGTQFQQLFININEKLGLGKKGTYNRFRSHMLRKYHASTLYNDGMSLDKVNDLQGKSKNKTDTAYFFVSSEDLRLEYIEHLPALQIGQEVEKITVKSKEFLDLERENNSLKSDIKSLKDDMSIIKGWFKEA